MSSTDHIVKLLEIAKGMASIPFSWIARGCGITQKIIGKSWTAIVAPEETRAAKKVAVMRSAVDVFTAIQAEKRRDLDWRIKAYRVLGLSDLEIRNRILIDIDRVGESLDLDGLLPLPTRGRRDPPPISH